MTETLRQDVRYGVRMLLRSPGFTAAALLTLALGIGANTAIFSVVYGVLLKPLPYAQPEGLVTIWDNFQQPPLPHISVSVPEYLDYASRAQSFESMTAYVTGSSNLADQGEADQISIGAATGTFFGVLGVRPALGRAFDAGEDAPGKDHVVVLGDGLWRRRFGADPNVVGRTIRLDGEGYEVIGVMPRGFEFPANTDAWEPFAFTDSLRNENNRGSRFLEVVARLKPGVSLEQARAEMTALGAGITAEHPNNYQATAGWHVTTTSLEEETVGDVRPALLVLLAAVGCVLLIACANVANLLLARGSARGREMAIRAALGAGRARVVRQLLTESVLLSVGGGVVGFGLAVWGVAVLTAVSPDDIPRLGEVSVDGRVLAFAAVLSLVTGVAFGIVPALRLSRPDVGEALKEGARGSTEGPHGKRVRNTLIVAEVALALVLLSCAGLLIKSFARLYAVDPGFTPEGTVTMQVALPNVSYPTSEKTTAFYREVLERTRALPGVKAVGATSLLPMRDNSSGTITSREYPIPQNMPAPEADLRIVSADYFRAMGIELVKGRYLAESDRIDSEFVAVVDETLAETMFPNGDALGSHLHLGGGTSTFPWMTIVGIVRHVRNQGLDDEGRIQLYMPYTQDPFKGPQSGMSLVARSDGDPTALVGAIRGAVRGIDPEVPVAKVETMEAIVAESLASRRLSVLLLGIFAAVALALAGVGLFGVLAYTVTQRTHEIGVRIALGARPFDVVRLVVGQGMGLVLTGVAIGLAGAYGAGQVIAGLLFGVSGGDPWTLATTAALLLVVAFAACLLPALRAARVDPMVALRYE